MQCHGGSRCHRSRSKYRHLAVRFRLHHLRAAKKSKHKKAADSSTTLAPTQHRGTNLVPAGPLYFSGIYLGDDPDPNIRFQLLRDISGRFGGEQ